MCGEKQSFKKIFAQGTGKECRQVVQKLNMISGNLRRQMLEDGYDKEHISRTSKDEHRNQETCRANQTTESKWNQFVTSDNVEVEQLDESANGVSFTTEQETVNKHKRKRPIKEITSDNCSKIPYPHNRRNGQSNLGSSDHEVNKVLSPKNKRSCTNEKLERQMQTCTATKISGPTQVSKWSKYT